MMIAPTPILHQHQQLNYAPLMIKQVELFVGLSRFTWHVVPSVPATHTHTQQWTKFEKVDIFARC